MEGVLIDSRYIQKFMEQNNLSVSSFSKICKIDIISFKNILKNKIDKIKEDEIKKFAKFMKCSIEEIIIELNSRY